MLLSASWAATLSAEGRANSGNPMEQLLRGINRGVALAAVRVGEVGGGLLLLLLRVRAPRQHVPALPFRSVYCRSFLPALYAEARNTRLNCCLHAACPLPQAFCHVGNFLRGLGEHLRLAL